MGDLFPAGALAAELREPGDPALLWPAEAKYLARAVPKRIQEFAAGRLCARRLLAEFGVQDFPVEMADDRRPLWPELLVGSITHTAGFCAAVVAECNSTAAIGMDSELCGSVKQELWPSICLPLEIDWLHSLPKLVRPAAATLIFSAKEAFYKCQYPLARQRLSFHDARVEVLDFRIGQAAFRLHLSPNVLFAEYAALPLQGQYLYHEEFVTAGVAVSR